MLVLSISNEHGRCTATVSFGWQPVGLPWVFEENRLLQYTDDRSRIPWWRRLALRFLSRWIHRRRLVLSDWVRYVVRRGNRLLDCRLRLIFDRYGMHGMDVAYFRYAEAELVHTKGGDSEQRRS